jgi:hypothetical protein
VGVTGMKKPLSSNGQPKGGGSTPSKPPGTM